MAQYFSMPCKDARFLSATVCQLLYALGKLKLLRKEIKSSFANKSLILTQISTITLPALPSGPNTKTKRIFTRVTYFNCFPSFSISTGKTALILLRALGSKQFAFCMQLFIENSYKKHHHLQAVPFGISIKLWSTRSMTTSPIANPTPASSRPPTSATRLP